MTVSKMEIVALNSQLIFDSCTLTGAFLLKRETMKIDDEYGLVASDDELNIYRRIDRKQKYNKKHKKASKRKSNTDKRKDAFYDDRKWR